MSKAKLWTDRSDQVSQCGPKLKDFPSVVRSFEADRRRAREKSEHRTQAKRIDLMPFAEIDFQPPPAINCRIVRDKLNYKRQPYATDNRVRSYHLNLEKSNKFDIIIIFFISNVDLHGEWNVGTSLE